MDKLMSESGVNLALLRAVLWENILSISFSVRKTIFRVNCKENEPDPILVWLHGPADLACRVSSCWHWHLWFVLSCCINTLSAKGR
jgi:hypothetical protein